MKRMATFFSVLVFTVCFFTGCNQVVDVSIDPTKVGVEFVWEGEDLLAAVITVENGSFGEDVSLAQVMKQLKDERTFTYSFSQGMLTEINGKKNTFSSCWMLYTNDTNMSTTEWTYTYKGQVLGSAILGAESLRVINDAIYVWAYQSV